MDKQNLANNVTAKQNLGWIRTLFVYPESKLYVPKRQNNSNDTPIVEVHE